MYTEYQEEFVYGIIWCVVLLALAATVAIIVTQGLTYKGPLAVLVAVDVAMLFGMKKYTRWLKGQRRRDSPNQAL